MNSNNALSSVPLLTLIFSWVSEAQVTCLSSHKKEHSRNVNTGDSQACLVPLHAVLSLPWAVPGKTIPEIGQNWSLLKAHHSYKESPLANALECLHDLRRRRQLGQVTEEGAKGTQRVLIWGVLNCNHARVLSGWGGVLNWIDHLL